MKATVSKSDLAQALAFCAPMASQPGMLDAPALIVAADGALTVSVSGVDGMAKRRIPASVATAGTAAVPHGELAKALANLTGDIRVEEAGCKLTLADARARYTLVGTSADDIPQWQEGDSNDHATAFSAPAADLAALLDAALYAIPRKDHRRVLMGVRLGVGGAEISATATDGKKLYRNRVALGEQDGPDAAIILPRQASAALGTLDGPVAVRLCAGHKMIVMTEDNASHMEVLGIDGKYPDCDAVIPKQYNHVFAIPADLLGLLAKAAKVTADDKNNSLVLKIGNGRIEAHSYHHDLGAFDGSIDCEGADFAPLELAFNATFLAESLGKLGENPVMRIRDQRAPVVFGDDEPGKTVLVMPIKLADVPKTGGTSDDE
jgi:DNA polymerase III sliding clamp (beta) subunit (PCNA family)